MKLNTILSSFKGPFWRKAQIVPHCTCIVEQSIGFADNSNFLFFLICLTSQSDALQQNESFTQIINHAFQYNVRMTKMLDTVGIS